MEGFSLGDMELSASKIFASKILYLPEIGSTNTELLARASESPHDWPDFSVIVTDNQTAGRGRLDRNWISKSGESLAVSVLLRPKNFDITRFGWLPLMAGLAMTHCVRSLVEDVSVNLKWPNDVLVADEKISGILAEVLPSGEGVVIGAGLNLSQQKADLPVENATSLGIHGVTGFQLDDILVRYLASLRRLYEQFEDEGGDSESSALRADLLEVLSTVGKRVSVQLPDGSDFQGKGVGLDNDGRLLVALTDPLEIRAVAAGDIKHLRQ